MGKLKYKVGSQFIVFENHQKMSHVNKIQFLKPFSFLVSTRIFWCKKVGLWTPKYFQSSKIIGKSRFKKKKKKQVSKVKMLSNETFGNSIINKLENDIKNEIFIYCALLFHFIYDRQTTKLTLVFLPTNKSLCSKKGLQHVEANQSLYWAITKNQRDTHSVWKSQKKSHSTLRAKRATFTF